MRWLAILLPVLMAFPGCGGESEPRYTFDVSDDTFDALVLKVDGPVLVMFHLPSCPHCQAMTPPVEDLAHDLAAELKVAKLNFSENPVTSQRYGVQAVPTFIMFKKGQAVASIVGEMPKEKLYDWVKNALMIDPGA